MADTTMPLALWSVGLLLAQGARAYADTPRPWPGDDFAAMGTTIEVIVPPEAPAAQAFAEVRAVFAELEACLSEWRAGSPLAAVNEAAGRAPVAVPPALLDLVTRAIAFGDTTHGAFDLTWAALWPLWQFHGEHLHTPLAADVQAAVRHVGYRRVVVDAARATVFLPEAGMKIGLGGIGKGYALDRAADRLRALGIHDFLLDAGGQVLALGTRDGAAWRVGLRDPRGTGASDLFAVVTVSGRSVSTSGDYEHFFVEDGVRYHHIIDPATGWPARGVASATAIAPDGTTADALSTAFVVLGVERALGLVAELRSAGQDVDAVLVDSDGGVHVTASLGAAYRVRRPLAWPKGTH